MTIAVYLVALFFLGMGVLALGWPVPFLSKLGSEVVSADGRSEVRAVYGGFGVFMAALLVYSTGAPAIAAGVFACAGLALLGMAAGRVVSAFVDGGISALMVTAMAGESLMGATLVAAWRYGL